MTLGLRYAARSHIGLVRDGNEDAAYAGPRLLAVADGMGGHAAGEVASAVVIAALAPLDHLVDSNQVEDDLVGALRRSALTANAQLRDLVASDPTLEGMGTTLTALLSVGDRLALLHIGDSRAYLLRDSELSQITRDHTLVQTLIDEGRITPEEAATHPQRSLVTRALDGRSAIDLDLSLLEARLGDRYLLCSDGLTGPVPGLDLLAEALQAGPPQEATDRLVSLALRGGGPDNVTVVVADVVELEHPPLGAPVVTGAAIAQPSAQPADQPAAQPAVEDPQASVTAQTGGGRRRLLLATGGLLVLALAAGSAWNYVQAQYYVGVQEGRVAVFQGVRGSFAGIALSRLDETTAVEIGQLSGLAATQVDRGIVAADRTTADQIVARLAREANGFCPSAAPALPIQATPAPSASPTAAPTAAPTLETQPAPCP